MQDLPIFERLVVSEAMIRGMDALKNDGFLSGGSHYGIKDADSGNSREAVADRLYNDFIATYDYQFQDSSQYHKVAVHETHDQVKAKRCNTRHLKGDDRQRLQQAFRRFVERVYDEHGEIALQDKRDKNVSVESKRVQAAQAIEALHSEITHDIPLNHAGMTVGVMMIELSRGKKWQRAKLTPDNGLDFTRGVPVKGNEMDARIESGFFSPEHKPGTSAYIPPPESVVTIAGLRFPSHKVDWQTYLVTPSGHLVNMTDELRGRIEAHIGSGRPLGEFKVPLPDADKHLVNHMQFENGNGFAMKAAVRKQLGAMAKKDEIDGQPVRDAAGQTTLVSIDEDLLTGLRITPTHAGEKSELVRVKEALKSFGVEKWGDLMSGDGVEARMEHIIKQARTSADTGALVPLLERAEAQLAKTLPLVKEASAVLFAGKKPADDKEKKMYLTQGGPGSGKSSLQKIARKECGDSLVVASMDDARAATDQIWLYMATHNHNHDYQSLTEFADSVRDVTTKKALKEGYNVLIDGSGIPYEGRNDKVLKSFHDKGYKTSVLATQIPLYVYNPQGRKKLSASNETYEDAFRRMGSRQDEELRALPINISIDKHIGFPIASHNSARDPNVDRFMLQDTYDVPYTLSFVIPDMKQEMVEKIARLEGEALLGKLREEGLVPPEVTLPKGEGHLAELKVIRDNRDHTYRVEIITDMQRYIGMVQTGLLNRNHSDGPEELFHNKLVCDIEGHFHGKDGILKLEPQGEPKIVPYPGTEQNGHHTSQLRRNGRDGSSPSV